MIQELKYNYFTVYLTEYLEDFKVYRFFKKGVECFTPENQIIYKSDISITSKEFEETIIKGTKYSMISSKILTSDLKEKIKTLLEEVHYLNKQVKNKKVVINWEEFPTITKSELKEELLTKLNEFTEITNRPMKEVEASLLQALWWLNLNSYILKDQ